jgi:radical SAM superfamily enzyme YgiQ (UPF0313 family)
MTKPLKVIVCTTPVRDKAVRFPPIGALSVLNYIRKNNDFVQAELYNIDVLRPSREEVIEHIRTFHPDVFGISAVVSTAYAYTKQLATDIKAMFPDTIVVVGGNGAAAANVLLENANVDICVLGEGEVVFNNVVNRAVKTRHIPDFQDIPGLAILDESGKLLNTGYEAQMKAEELWDIDFADLEKTGSLENYIYPLFDGDHPVNAVFGKDPRTYQPHRRDKKIAWLDCVKGCVARCTFCHRWDKGIRHIPVDILMQRLEYLIEHYNVGVVAIHAETFGADKKWLAEFLDKIKKYDVLWAAGGVRANTLNADWVRRIRDAGCNSISYGNETGSPKMLQIMEKKVTLEDNYRSMKEAVDVGFFMGMQFVLGMPGESDETVRETIDYIKYGTTLAPTQNPDNFAMGYAQALPGTPLYEYARHKGYIGRSTDEEEDYLIRVSNHDAMDASVAINYTDTPKLRWLAWRPLISIEVYYNYIQTFGLAHYFKVLMGDIEFLGGGSGSTPSVAKRILSEHMNTLLAGKSPPMSVFFKLLRSDKPGLTYVIFPVLFYRLRRFVTLLQFLKIAKTEGLNPAINLGWEYLVHHATKFFNKSFTYEYKSLRKIVDNDLAEISTDGAEMAPVRQGR